MELAGHSDWYGLKLLIEYVDLSVRDRFTDCYLINWSGDLFEGGPDSCFSRTIQIPKFSAS
ncbi:MAG TPA: hypothetical protein VJM12_06275, partial [Pyrinomonadaceae bacterium]|nr:hypothetical protein [Pyrinomonadaceae bacterium]